jgi:hypothetical protein
MELLRRMEPMKRRVGVSGVRTATPDDLEFPGTVLFGGHPR